MNTAWWSEASLAPTACVALCTAAVIVLAPAGPAAKAERRLAADGCVLIAIPGNAFTHVRAPERRSRDRWTHVAGFTNATSTFTVTYEGFENFPLAQAAFQAGVDIWADLLASPVPIKVRARFLPLGANILGSAGSRFIWMDFAGAPRPGTWYSDALADRLAGVDLAPPNEVDIIANFSSSFANWYFGTDGNTPGGMYDFLSVVLHELGHGLGFVGAANVDQSGLGTLGLGGFPRIYDVFTVTEWGMPMLAFPNPSAALGTQLRQGYVPANPRGPGVYWGGQGGMSGNGGPTARLYTPNTWAGGSSYSHLDDSTYPAGHINSLMTHALQSAEAIHDPGPVTLGLFADSGWNAQQPDLIVNGSFSSGAAGWLQFATPDPGYIVSDTSGGTFNFYRVPPPQGTTNQATVFQQTGLALPAGAPAVAVFDLANTSSVRKRLSVLMLDSDFTDLHVCTFWLEASVPMRRYAMKTRTTKAWANATIAFYAATAGSDGGSYQIDNVTMQSIGAIPVSDTNCFDPTTPKPPGGAAGADLMVNGSFTTGTPAPWLTFGQIVWQVAAGVFEFYRPASTPPAGVVFQGTNTALPADQIVTATFKLGNSSGVRKRVTVLLHDLDFSDLHACTFWVPPGLPLSTYSMRSYASKAWTNTTVSVYPATTDALPWIRLDDVQLRSTPASTALGTECVEPPGAL